MKTKKTIKKAPVAKKAIRKTSKKSLIKKTRKAKDSKKKIIKKNSGKTIKKTESSKKIKTVTKLAKIAKNTEIKPKSIEKVEEIKRIEEPLEIERPPIVVILGQVDHGKTTLLDYIRKTNLASKEIGGITQDIGAYEAEYKGDKIIFIDTPGHQAFSKLRIYGSKVADIGIIIIDSTEGIKEQTIESLSILKENKIPFLIAINKIDKPGADAQKIKNELLKFEVQVEELGGDIPSINISATKGDGIEELLELVVLIGKLHSLKANKNNPGGGFIIYGKENSTKGIEVSLVLKNGSIKKGDYIISETSYGKIKRMEDVFAKELDKVTFPKPIKVFGFEKVPDIGEKFNITKDKIKFEKTRNKINKKLKEINEALIFGNPNSKYLLNIMLKVPTLAIKDALVNLLKTVKLKNTYLKINKISLGDINLNDINFAQLTNSLILGFKVKILKDAINKANNFKVRYKTYEIIYDIEKEIYDLIKENIKKEVVRENLGKIKVLKIFTEEKEYQIMGAKMISGVIIKKNGRFEILRRNFKIGEGRVLDLEQNKVKSSKIENNQEFGAMINSDRKINVNDELQTFEEKEIETEI